jgi:hypothetical protein
MSNKNSLHIVCWILLFAFFVGYRWSMRLEPRNGDDMLYFQYSMGFTQGNHWLLSGDPGRVYPPHKFRTGILPFSVPTIGMLGANQWAYYSLPLLFSLWGFALVYWVLGREVSLWIAFAFCLLHVLNPWELFHASQFFLDLPSAVCLLSSLLLIIALSEHCGAKTVWLSAILSFPTGALAILAYLMRVNSVILMVPALTFLFFRRKTRQLTFFTGLWLAAGIGLEQILLISKGLGFGNRWAILKEMVEFYAPNIPFYTPLDFALRPASFVWKLSGGSVTGIVLLCATLAILILHLIVLWKSKSVVLKVLALTGLATWVFFWYMPQSFQDGLIRPAAIPLPRYYQPFLYSATLVAAWTINRGLEHFRHSKLAIAGTLALLIMAGTISIQLAGKPLRNRLTRPGGELIEAVRAIDGLAKSESSADLQVHTTHSSARLLSVFRNTETDPPVLWARSSLKTMADLGPRKAPYLFLDEARETRNQRYRKGLNQTDLSQLRERIWNDYELILGPNRFGLYRAGSNSPTKSQIPNGTFSDTKTGLIPFWQTTHPVTLAPLREGGASLSDLPQKFFYLYSGTNTGLSVVPKPQEDYQLGETRRVFAKIRLDYPESVDARACLIQFDESRRITLRWATLRPGTSYVSFGLEPEAEYYRLGIRFSQTKGSDAEVKVHEVFLRK